MKRRVFLSGPIGCGKSTLIKNALGAEAKNAGGYVTVRIERPDGTLSMFELREARSLASHATVEVSPLESGFPFLTFTENGAARDDGAFRAYAANLLRDALSAPFAVLDELGGAELTIPEFARSLYALLQSGVPVIGVLKAPEAVEALRARVGVPEGYAEAEERLRRFLENDPDTLILETAGRRDPAAAPLLRAWKEEFVHDEEPRKAL